MKRRKDGSLDLRLTAARRREPGIGPNLLLLYLVQMMAYQDFSVDGGLTGLPVLMANPSVTFEGVVRGRRYRHRDLGGQEQDGEAEARRLIHDFGRSDEGRAYRPWVERFLAGTLPLRFGDDPRERWWRLFPLQRKQSLLELRGRHEPGSGAAESARNIKALLDRLSREIGRTTEEEPGVLRINDLGREGVLRVLAEANVETDGRAAVADEILAAWPHRSLDQLLARAPGARGLRRLKSRLSFGQVVSEADQGTPRSLGPAPKRSSTRAVANRELFGAARLPASLHAAAARTFPSFEAYMDAGLHAPRWGYYGHRVQIGHGGHFETHPEELSPHYGAWLASWAFKAWRDLVAHGELREAEPFFVVEFGAGNGRLAQDILDGIARLAADSAAPDPEGRRTFASRVQYRIYEMSAALRARQRELLGERAVVAEGDARSPGATLERDFPGGLKGLVITNEVPDAFGVHKVLVTAAGQAFAALVVPRVERELARALGDELAARIARADAAARQTFGFDAPAGELYLDAATFSEVMDALSHSSDEARDAQLSALWFEEAYVPVSELPELAAHLADNASEYALALAAEDSGVVLYVNVHADGFMRGLGSALAAGLVVTIDYGDCTWGLVQGARRGDFPFRVYGEWRDYVPRPNDPYFKPGTQDMTADVNFTDLARAGARSGLELIHFGPERDVIADALPQILRTADAEPFAKFLGNPGFKILVLGTRQTGAFAFPLMTPEPLSRREQDVPKMQREKIPSIQKKLEAASPGASRAVGPGS